MYIPGFGGDRDMNRLPVIVRQHIAGFRALLVFTVLCGLIYPAGHARHLARWPSTTRPTARWSATTATSSGRACSARSSWTPRATRCRSTSSPGRRTRSIAASKTDYGCDPLFSAASNLGPDQPGRVQRSSSGRRPIAAFDHVPVSQIPPDAVTASGSGLDPDISPRTRPSRSTGSPRPGTCRCPRSRRWWPSTSQGRTLGFLGEPHGERAQPEHRARPAVGEVRLS